MRGLRIGGALAVACVVGSVMLPASAGAPAALLGGCFADTCAPDGFTIESNQGYFIDANTWASARIDGTWFDFQGADYIFFRPDFGGRTPYYAQFYVSVSANPVRDNNLIAEATGNIAEQNNFGPNQVAVTNGTCAHYYVRAIVYAEPFPPAAPDAGPSEPDAGDAGPDAAP